MAAEFLENLFIKVDFEGAQQKLKECEEVIDNDYFLTAMKAEFVENARWFIFETYCRIHQCIDLRMLADKLGMPEDAAERWIVNLIRSASSAHHKHKQIFVWFPICNLLAALTSARGDQAYTRKDCLSAGNFKGIVHIKL